MVATQKSVPSRRESASVVARVPMPHTLSAGLISTSSSSIFRYTGSSEAPSMMMASQPAFLMAAPIMPPVWASTT